MSNVYEVGNQFYEVWQWFGYDEDAPDWVRVVTLSRRVDHGNFIFWNPGSVKVMVSKELVMSKAKPVSLRDLAERVQALENRQSCGNRLG